MARTGIEQQTRDKSKQHPLNGISERIGPFWRVPLLGAAILGLLAAIWAGWVRMGWQIPVLQPSIVGAHGPLMVAGFFGTLISIERAVALRRAWPYIGPALSGLGGILLIAGVPGPLPALLLAAGGFWLAAIFATILRRHLARYTLVMAAGALALAVGNAFWLAGWPVHRVILWWAAFLVLTIAGERLELGRLARYPRWVENLFTGAAGLFLGGIILAVFLPDSGTRLASIGLLGLAAWLLRFDIARKTLSQVGLPRFAAVCLLSGYAWLAAAGGLGLRSGAVPAGFLYDAFLHSIFLGFVFAMIFAHAPIIFPAILGLPVAFKRIFYLPLVLLHLSLLARVAGDLLFIPWLRLWGGMLNGITILVFLGLTGRSILACARQRQEQPKPASAAPVEDRAGRKRNELRLRQVWAGALAAFILAGLTGSLMRYGLLAGLPAGIQFANVRHAHSHLMYFAWVTPALMALIAARLPAHTGRAAPGAMVWSAQLALVFGLLAYPPFFLAGYEPLAIAGLRLPLSIFFSSLNLLAWYAFYISYRQAVRGARRSRPLKLWNAALAFLLAASLGAWGRALLTALNVENAFLSAAAIHLFLDLFSGGWAVLGLLGLLYSSRPELARAVSGWEDPLLFIGLPLSFLLGTPVDLVPADLRTLAGLGGMMAAAGLALHVKRLWPVCRSPFWSGWGLPLALLLLKAALDAASSFAPLARWGELVGLRIFYLHVLLLGFVTLGLIAAGLGLRQALPSGSAIPGQPERRPVLGWMGLAVLALLASLLPLTGLWPAALAGGWRGQAAFALSFGPTIAAIFLLVSELRIMKTLYAVTKMDTGEFAAVNNRDKELMEEPRFLENL